MFGRVVKRGRQWTVTKVWGKNWKSLKTDLFVLNTRFSQLSQVASKLPVSVAKTLKTQILKNLSKCFSRLEVLPVRESRDKLRKSLCTPRDWNLHPRTSRQIESCETIKMQILKNNLSIFRDWDIDPPVSHEKSLCGLATRTCDWTNPRLSRQNKATLFLKFLTFLQKQKIFRKQLKH